MKKHLLLICFLITISAVTSFGQSAKLPPFAMLLTNGNVFRAQQLPVGKPMIIIYFSPECGHCETMMESFIKDEAAFRKASVVLITHLAVSRVAAFAGRYHLNRYPNIYVGTEGNSFFVRNFYRVEQMPFIALHDKNGDMVKVYRKDGAIADVVSELRKLK